MYIAVYIGLQFFGRGPGWPRSYFKLPCTSAHARHRTQRDIDDIVNRTLSDWGVSCCAVNSTLSKFT